MAPSEWFLTSANTDDQLLPDILVEDGGVMLSEDGVGLVSV